MIINREWSMPNKNTFSIRCIGDLIQRYINEGAIVADPFANNSKYGTITNDLDESMDTDYHMDATDFLTMLESESVDVVLYDPPFTPRQVSEVYKRLGKTVNMETTQASYWRKHKDQIARILKKDGICICCGYNSNGIGKTRGFELVEILMVAHGGSHNDTIVTVEKKL